MDSDFKGFACYWRIENFFLRRFKKNITLYSPNFSDNIFESTWSLQLHQNIPDFLDIYLVNENFTTITINFSFSYLTSCGWILDREGEEKEFNWMHNWKAERFVSSEKISGDEWNYLPSGSLTICCRIWSNKSDKLKNESSQCILISRLTTSLELHHRTVLNSSSLKPDDFLHFLVSYQLPGGKASLLKEKEASSTQSNENNTLDDLESLITLIKENKFSLVTLHTPSKDFVVPKAALCAKSPVFYAMFQSNMKENSNNSVEINDIDSETLSFMLQHLYLEPIDLMWDDAVKLYYAADKYQIDTLKKACVVQLKKILSIDNVCEAFILADLHHDEDLKQSAVDYFCQNSKSILLSRDWKELMLKKTELATEILCAMAEKAKFSN